MTSKYKDWVDQDTFVVSALVSGDYPVDEAGNEIIPRVLLKSKRFDSLEVFLEWCKATYGRVHEDCSNLEMGILAARVPKKYVEVRSN